LENNITIDKSHYYIDFSKSDKLSDDEKKALERIQELYRPVERAELLNEYRVQGKLTDDEFTTLTGIPYCYGS